MSLLLQALQNAAKNRDEKQGNPEGEQEENADLTLEPLGEPQLREDSSGDPVRETQTPTASREYAAGVMSASEQPRYSAIDWAREHYMVTTLSGLALFALLYAIYVYIQISQPTLLRPSTPQPLQTVSAPPASQVRDESLQVSGLPASGDRDAANEASQASARTSTASRDDDAQSVSNTTTTTTVSAVTRLTENSSGSGTNRAQSTPSTTKAAKRTSSPASRVVSSTDRDGVEIVEIPAAPSILALEETTKAGSVQSESLTPVDREVVIEQQVNESPIDPILLMAYEALQQGNYEKAQTLYSRVLQKSPDNIDALLGLAAITWKQGRPGIASQYYSRVLEIEPRNVHAQAGLIALLGSADPVAAESKLKQLIAREPSGFLYFTLGNLYAERGQWAPAQHAYAQAYQLQPTNADYTFNLAVGFEHLGQPKQALDFYRKALDQSFKKGKANFDQELAIERIGQLSARVE